MVQAHNKVIIPIILGPTAVGKTGYAIDFARAVNGEIISADSMQIYRGMNIGTAKPSQAERRAVPHHMLDIIGADEEFSVGAYKSLAEQKINEVLSRGKIPIICGGTGLYVRALLYGHDFAETPRSSDIREKYRAILEARGKEYLYELLTDKDSVAAAKLHCNDFCRVIRALEIIEARGLTKTELMTAGKQPCFRAFTVGLNIADRAALYDAIDKRVDGMAERGLVDEVRGLLNAGISADAQSMRAIGYKETARYLAGAISETAMMELIKKNSRNYAKRQLTYLRHQFEDISWAETAEAKQKLLKKYCTMSDIVLS
jgi:tRNA dimethylallyltransferase